MYAAATAVYARATDYAFLLPVPRLFVWIALAVWLAAFNGLLFRTVRAAIGHPKRGGRPSTAALPPPVPLPADARSDRRPRHRGTRSKPPNPAGRRRPSPPP